MNDDMLILYYYGDELSDGERRSVQTALEADPLLAARYRELEREMGLIGPRVGKNAAAVSLPNDLRQRLHATIDRAADLERGRERPRRPHWSSFLLGAGLTAAIAIGVGLGMRVTNPPPGVSEPIAATGALPLDESSVFDRAIKVYFRDSRLDVQSRPDSGNGARTAMIMNLVAQNRSFARLAQENEAPDLARVLRAFEPILARLAAEDISAEESEALRAKLAFELNVMLTRLTREASEYTTSTEQET
jgi:anti-sigma factor RsiW